MPPNDPQKGETWQRAHIWTVTRREGDFLYAQRGKRDREYRFLVPAFLAQFRLVSEADDA